MIGSVLHLGVTPENFDLVQSALVLASSEMDAPASGKVKVFNSEFDSWDEWGECHFKDRAEYDANEMATKAGGEGVAYAWHMIVSLPWAPGVEAFTQVDGFVRVLARQGLLVPMRRYYQRGIIASVTALRWSADYTAWALHWSDEGIRGLKVTHYDETVIGI